MQVQVKLQVSGQESESSLTSRLGIQMLHLLCIRLKIVTMQYGYFQEMHFALHVDFLKFTISV